MIKDVYRDRFILAKMIRGKFDLDDVDRNLCNVIYKISEEDHVGVDTVLITMKSSNVMLFQVNLFKIMFISVLAESNVIPQDEKYKNCLTKSVLKMAES